MIKPITASTIVFLFLLTTTIQASDNPIPFDEAAAKAQARELKAKILQENKQTKDLYRDRANIVVTNFNNISDDQIIKRKPIMHMKLLEAPKPLEESDFKLIKKLDLKNKKMELLNSEQNRYEVSHGIVK